METMEAVVSSGWQNRWRAIDDRCFELFRAVGDRCVYASAGGWKPPHASSFERLETAFWKALFRAVGSTAVPSD